MWKGYYDIIKHQNNFSQSDCAFERLQKCYENTIRWKHCRGAKRARRPKWYFTFDCHFGAKFIQSAILYATQKVIMARFRSCRERSLTKTNPRAVSCRAITHVIKGRWSISKNKIFVWKKNLFNHTKKYGPENFSGSCLVPESTPRWLKFRIFG